MAIKNYLVVQESYIHDRLVHAGQIIQLDEKQVKYRDGVIDQPNLAEVPEGGDTVAIVQVSAIAPTGPNPVNPQQVPPDARQTVEGWVKPGAQLVGEKTLPAEERLAEVDLGDGESEGKIEEAVIEKSVENADAAIDPLDHDENGKKGGSKPRAKA